MLKEKSPLSLNQQIELFNREVHAFEDQQQAAITNLWEKINKDYIDTHQLSDLRAERLKNGFAQAMANLAGMMQAKTLYEADLYRQSYIKALELVKTPRRRFIMLQSMSLGLAHDSNDVKPKLAVVEKELLNLKSLYGKEENSSFESAHTELKEMSQLKDPALFAQKKKVFLEHLADIHERVHQRTSTEKQCEADVEEAINRGQGIYDARASYLEDKNHWMSRAKDVAEKSWTGIGAGLSVLGIVLAVPAIIGGLALAPIGIFVAGVVGAAYGVFDMAKTFTSHIADKTTAKLGEREIPKPPLTRKEKFKQFAKKAAPIALCVLGAAIGIAAIVLTAGVAGIALAVAGVALTAAGVGQMAYDKYQEKKEVNDLQQEHKEINEPFDKTAEELIKQTPAETQKEQYTDSLQETMTLLSGHMLTESDIKTVEEESESEEDEGGTGTEETTLVEDNEETEEGDSGAEGEKEDEPAPEDEFEPPSPRP